MGPLRRAGPTFLVHLQHRGRRCGHLHGQAVGPSEGVAVPDDEGPGFLVLQHGDGCRGERRDVSICRGRHGLTPLMAMTRVREPAMTRSSVGA